VLHVLLTVTVLSTCCRTKVSSWCREKVAGQDWMDAMTGKCEGCFKIREAATTSPTTNHSSHAVPPAFSGQQGLS
jgi:hypothetical protein